MPSSPALPIEIRVARNTAENGSGAMETANSNQIAKKGSHAANAIAHRLMTLRTMSRLIMTIPAGPLAPLTAGNCRFTETADLPSRFR